MSIDCRWLGLLTEARLSIWIYVWYYNVFSV